MASWKGVGVLFVRRNLGCDLCVAKKPSLLLRNRMRMCIREPMFFSVSCGACDSQEALRRVGVEIFSGFGGDVV